MTTLSLHTEPPPDVDQHDGDGDEPDGSALLRVQWIARDDTAIHADVQLFGPVADDPEAFADAVLRAVLGAATTIGPDHAWALTQRLAAYDGTRP